MKSFFASVECAERGLDAMTTKLVVADISRTDKTICLAVSPAMKALGVKNRCRLFEIPKHIDFITAPPRMRKYIQYAAKIYAIYLKYISKYDIYQYSIDECFIDVTSYLKLYDMKAMDFAKKLLKEIIDTLGIPATCGIGTNMYLAKIALDITAKNAPDRIGWLTEDKFKKTLWTHQPITDFWGISHGIASRLEKYGIRDMRGIALCNEDVLYDEFGVNAELMIDHSKGIETALMSDVKKYKPRSKSFSNSQVLFEPYKTQDARIVMQEMLQEGCYRLFREGAITALINIYIGYQNDMVKFSKGTRRVFNPTNLPSVIVEEGLKLFDSIVDKSRMVRRMGISFADLRDETTEVVDLFTDSEKVEKEKKFLKMVLEMKDKHGKNILLKGTDFEEKATQRMRNKQIGGHSSGED